MGKPAKYIGILVLGCMTSSFSYGDDLLSILQIALENDPTLRQAEASYRENRESMIQSRASLLPSLGIGGSTSRLTSGPTDSIYSNVTDPTSGETLFKRVANDHSFRPGLNNHGWGMSLSQSVLNLSLIHI